MKICVHDFAGHPFQAQLSRWLASRGYDVVHCYCGGVTTGRGDLQRRAGDPPRLRFMEVSAERFERYSPVGRLRSEWRYGTRAALLVDGEEPHVVISANGPLVVQALLWRTCRRIGASRIYWLQDFLGRGTRQVLHQRSRLLGATAGTALEALETRMLARSDALVVISEDFLAELQRRGVTTPATVIENWTPLDEIDVQPKDNPWSRVNGYAERPVALYSGTLGLKHDPEHLVAAAQRLASNARLIVVTEGLGREHLERRKRELCLGNLDLLDYVDYSQLPEVLGAADVCLVLLEREAGTFSVPSKALTYLASGRAIVGAMPAVNLAARILAAAGAGVTVEPGDFDGFADAVAELIDQPLTAAELGRRGRAYAVDHFDIDAIGDAVLQVIERARSPR